MASVVVVPQYYSTSCSLDDVVEEPMCSSLPCEPNCKGNCPLGKFLLAFYDSDDSTFYVKNFGSAHDVCTLPEAIDCSQKRPATAEYFWLWVSLRSKQVIVVQPPTSLKISEIKCSFNHKTNMVDVNKLVCE